MMQKTKSVLSDKQNLRLFLNGRNLLNNGNRHSSRTHLLYNRVQCRLECHACIMHCINILHMTLYLLLPPSDIHMNYTHNYLYSHTIVQRKWGLTLLNQVNWEWQAACVYGAVVQNGYGTGIRVELLICMCTDRALATARTAASPGNSR